jgi:hypothetical protein
MQKNMSVYHVSKQTNIHGCGCGPNHRCGH